MTDLSKRANLRGVREQRLAAPEGVPGAHWGIAPLSLREDSTDPSFWQFRGEASVVDHPYTVHDAYGSFTETIRAGAFDKTLNDNPLVSLVYMHDMATVMAQTRGGELSLSPNPHLLAAARLAKDDIDVQRIAPKMFRGLANAMSFGFRVSTNGQTWNEDFTVREITEVNLQGGDVSIIVTGHGANPAAAGALRAAFPADEALLALRAGTASADQIAALAELVSNAIEMADDSFDVFLAALNIPDPDAAEDVAEEGTEQNSGPDPEELRVFLERLATVRERARDDEVRVPVAKPSRYDKTLAFLDDAVAELEAAK